MDWVLWGWLFVLWVLAVVGNQLNKKRWRREVAALSSDLIECDRERLDAESKVLAAKAVVPVVRSPQGTIIGPRNMVRCESTGVVKEIEL